MDLDLEAPGLENFPDYKPPRDQRGILDYIHQYYNDPDPDNLPSIKNCIHSIVEKEKQGKMWLIPSGSGRDDYLEKLKEVNWRELYTNRAGFTFFKNLKQKIADAVGADYLLIDSRTGWTDISAIATRQLADTVALIFGLNDQNLEGAIQSYETIDKTPRDKAIRFILAASPMPFQFGYDKIDQKLEIAGSKMSGAENSGIDDKPPILRISYHPLLAIEEALMVVKEPKGEPALTYFKLADYVEKLNREYFETLINKAKKLFKESKLKNAEAEFRKIHQEYPSDPTAVYLWGNFLMLTGKLGKAVEQFKYALKELDPNHFPTLSGLGTGLIRLGKLKEALKAWETARNIDDTDKELLRKILKLARRLNCSDDIVRLTKLKQKLDEDSPSASKDPLETFLEGYPKFISAKFLDSEEDRIKFWNQLAGDPGKSLRQKQEFSKSVISGEFEKESFQKFRESFEKEKSEFLELNELETWEELTTALRAGEIRDLEDESGLKDLIENGPQNKTYIYKYLLAENLLKSTLDTKKERLAKETPNFESEDFEVKHSSKAKEDALLKCVNLCDQALKLNSNFYPAYYTYGIALYELAQFKTGSEAETHYKTALQKFQKTTEIRPNHFEAFFKQKYELPNKNKEKEDYPQKTFRQDVLEIAAQNQPLLKEYGDIIAQSLGHNSREIKRFLYNLNLRQNSILDSNLNPDQNLLENALFLWAIIEIYYGKFAEHVQENPKSFRETKQFIEKLINDQKASFDDWRVSEEMLVGLEETWRGFIKNKNLVELIANFPEDESVIKAVIEQSKTSSQIGEFKITGKYEHNYNPDAMITIAMGPFLYGDKKEEKTIDQEFKIDIYPVTNERYSRFIADNGYIKEKLWSQEGWQWKLKNNITQPHYWNDPIWNAPDHPVVGVSWYEADAFARWENKRLPTELEWERSARGTDGRKYPWGDEFDPEKCNYGFKIGKTTPVNHFPNGISPDGCFDMAGNVWEWTADCYNEEKKWRVLRGGSWSDISENVRCADRTNYDPNDRDDFFGFRCAQ